MGLFKNPAKKGRTQEGPDVGGDNTDNNVSEYAETVPMRPMSIQEEPAGTDPSPHEEIGESTHILGTDSDAGMVLDGLKESTSEAALEAETSGLEGFSIQDDLLGVFEDETEVDEKLKTLVSRVEDVRAEDVIEELRNLMQYLQTS